MDDKGLQQIIQQVGLASLPDKVRKPFAAMIINRHGVVIVVIQYQQTKGLFRRRAGPERQAQHLPRRGEEVEEEEHAQGLLARLGAELGSEARELARELEERRLAVSRDGEKVFVYPNPAHIHAFNKDTGVRLGK